MLKPLDFKTFERRVRLVRFWRGATFGLLCGSLLACLLVAFFRLRGQIAPWPYAVTLAAVSCLVWALVSALRRISQFDLADSLDRRGALKNRLATAISLTTPSDAVEAELQADAAKHLNAIRPQRVYPIRFGKLQGLALALALAAGIVTVLGNRPITLSAAEREKRADSDEAANNIERVLKPYEEEKPNAADAKQKQEEVAQMQKLARDLRDGKIDRAEAMQKANKAVEDAKKLEQKTAETAKAKLETAETAMQAMEDKALQDAMPMDPSAELASEEQSRVGELQKQIDATKKEIEKATGKETEALRAKLNNLKSAQDSAKKAAAEGQAALKGLPRDGGDDRQIQDLLRKDSPPNAGGGPDPMAEFKRLRSNLIAATQAEIANIKERLKTATGAEAERLRKKLAELESQLAEAKKEVEAFNKALAEAIKAGKYKGIKPAKPGESPPMMHTKFSKPMRSAMEKMKQALHKIESGDDLSEAESKQLNNLADQMDVEAAKATASGDKEQAMTAKTLAQVARLLATGNASLMIACACQSGLGDGSLASHDQHGNSHQASPGSYMPTSSENNIGKVNHLDKEALGQGKTTPTMIDPLKGDGPSSYIEVRGPASLGARSAIPYRTVLPSYQRKEEAALNRGKIPKKHLKRVRAYFDSLNGH